MEPEDLARFLREDLGVEGDVTSLATIPAEARASARMVAREACVVAGLAEACDVFVHLGASATREAADGARVAAGATVLRVEGPARAILAGERLALNFVMRMSGIASLAREIQDRLPDANHRCRIAATRKTTPGFRAYEKRAVVLGGGEPHRAGLHDAFLVKDNHLATGISIREAVARCRRLDPAKIVEVEADDAAQAIEAAEARADVILLDNMPPEEARGVADLARAKRPGVLIECSGGIRPGNAHLWAFADRVSLGALTLSAAAKDFGLDFA